MATLEYKLFAQKHPAWNGPYWDLCERMRAGGSALLKDQRALRECLRPGMNEDGEVWRERSCRAVYPNYAGEICGYLVATVFSDPLTIQLDGEGDEPDDPPEEWSDWFEDVSKPGTSKRCSLAEHMKRTLDRLLTDGVAYTLVDFPTRDGLEVYTRAQEDAMGLRRAYLCEIDPAAVVEWEDDDAGDLLWAMIKSVSARRKTIADKRNMVTERYRIVGREGWQLWEITYDKELKPDGPAETDLVTLVAQGRHTFGRVPLIRHRLPSSLWAMDRMFSLACATLQNASGAQWLLAKTNTPTPFLKHQNVKLDSEQPADEIAGGRKMPKQTGGVMMLAERDELGWSSPPPDPITVALAVLQFLRSELYRTMDAMARAIDPSAASNRQSGESKAMDASTTSVISKELGNHVREETLTVLRVVEAGRGEEPADWVISGCDEVEIDTPKDAVDEIAALELVVKPPLVVELEWARFARLRGYTDEQIKQVREQAREMGAADNALKDAEREAAMTGHERTVEGVDPATGEPFKEKVPAKSKGKGAPKK